MAVAILGSDSTPPTASCSTRTAPGGVASAPAERRVSPSKAWRYDEGADSHYPAELMRPCSESCEHGRGNIARLTIACMGRTEGLGRGMVSPRAR